MYVCVYVLYIDIEHYDVSVCVCMYVCVCVCVYVCMLYTDIDIEHYDVSRISDSNLQNLEADSFWCFSKLLDGIQDNYTFAQPGIQIRVNSLKDLISRIDS